MSKKMLKQVELLRKAIVSEILLQKAMATGKDVVTESKSADQAWQEFNDFCVKYTKAREAHEPTKEKDESGSDSSETSEHEAGNV